ncbi:MAG: 1,4-alpha-glucan branching enzyme C-terminal, partial [Solirubrobacteraceae bacterium]|nr:1,4-alpha-glucan branching enzyme C-terminal [Solirubrobacteraceae bacterium]
LLALAAGGRAGDPAARELLAVQASDWAFLTTRAWAGDYPTDRVRAHAHELGRALAGDPGAGTAARNLAVHAGAAALREP